MGKEGKYLLGGWIHTADFEKISNGDNIRNNYGFYAMAQQSLYKEKNKDNEGLDLILQTGWAPKDRNTVNKYYGIGLLYKGLIPKRDNDTLGFGCAWAGFSSDNPDIIKNSEKLVEVFYKIQVTKWLALQPDLQYILHPNASDGSSFAFGLRTILIF